MSGKSKYTFKNERYLENIDCEKKAYFLGLIFADGSLNNKLCTLQVALVQDDDYILKNLCNEVYLDRNLRVIYPKKPTHKIQSQMTITSKLFYNDLLKYNLNQNKSKIGQWVNERLIPKELISHFIRGYFDGDGCIYHNKSNGDKTISFTGNSIFIENLRRFLVTELDLRKGNISKRHKDGNSVTLSFGGLKQIAKIKEFLYKDSTIYLERKFIKFQL